MKQITEHFLEGESPSLNASLRSQYFEKKLDNSTCIDLTSRPKNFQESSTLETGFSDFYQMVLTVLTYEVPKVFSYRK